MVKHLPKERAPAGREPREPVRLQGRVRFQDLIKLFPDAPPFPNAKPKKPKSRRRLEEAARERRMRKLQEELQRKHFLRDDPDDPIDEPDEEEPRGQQPHSARLWWMDGTEDGAGAEQLPPPPLWVDDEGEGEGEGEGGEGDQGEVGSSVPWYASLPPDDLALAERLVRAGGKYPRSFISDIGHITINGHNIAALGDGSVVDNEVVDAVFTLAAERQSQLRQSGRLLPRVRFTTTDFWQSLAGPDDGYKYNYEAVKSHNNIQGISVFEVDYLAVPICDHGHWSLGFVDEETGGGIRHGHAAQRGYQLPFPPFHD
ncbi:unnamed protein product [Vitrella brassicaformis CCMP3155]|uniref:Ubiquitin-like protease family profile domain-containing protein n=1 Tax=Vitrella brassicaformis (strain CCMP3155) TaxID=1169540 RepID=A0A0G4EPR3_VITBC|nr:unnamed protein product [Vitrella brassicaformis CCMP3155]|eukprot:CEL99551.1 unnamed protein product [Vitrella brassicaformis CCMP3155]